MTMIAARLVPVARRSPKPNQRIRRGTMMVPPPTPKRPLKAPAAVPIAASLAVRSETILAILDAVSADPTPVKGVDDEVLDALRASPERTALMTDIDGTLAPIVARPEEAAVPERATRLLEELAGRFGLVGCVSGRRATEARRL